jgi:hypothetical protein
VRPNGTLAGGDDKGALRVHGCAGTPNFVAGSLLANTCAYNSVTSQFIP